MANLFLSSNKSFEFNNILVLSQNCLFKKGGAELSLFNFVRSMKLDANTKIDIVGLNMHCNLKKINWRVLPYTVNIHRVFCVPTYSSKYFQYFQLFFMLPVIMLQLLRIKTSGKTLVLSQNRWSLFAFLCYKLIFGCKLVIFLRDEKCLGVFNNYHIGFARYIWFAINIVEFPFKILYQRLVKLAFNSADQIISNSQFMSQFAHDKFNISQKKLYLIEPQIDIESLKNDCLNKSTFLPKTDRLRIVMVGTSPSKGFHVFKKLAAIFPDFDFVVFGSSEQSVTNNIHHIPFSDSYRIYQNTDIVIVPSIWQEAFGRVAFESLSLGIPTIVSNRGNLPYLADRFDHAYVANDINDYAFYIQMLSVKI